MMKNKKVYVEIVAFLVLFYSLFVLPYFNNINSNVLSTVMFLNFDNFESLQLEKFNIQYMIAFIMLFQIVYLQNTTTLSNNATYLSMALHKLGKKKQVLLILIENAKMIGHIFIFMVICIGVLSGIIIFQNGSEFGGCIKIIVYLIKYFIFIYTLLTIYQIRCIIKVSYYFILQSYFLFIGMILCDMMLKTHLITLSNTILIELVWLLLISILSIVCLVLIIKWFENTKEVCND